MKNQASIATERVDRGEPAGGIWRRPELGDLGSGPFLGWSISSAAKGQGSEDAVETPGLISKRISSEPSYGREKKKFVSEGKGIIWKGHITVIFVYWEERL